MIKHVGKRGDTLIEVMLAVGIFCMVAVAVVAVMSGGTSSSQSALETTVTREEIDSQAEALRFIHRSYVADKKIGTTTPYGQLWQDITALAVSGTTPGDLAERQSIIEFQPGSCQEDLYDSGKQVSKHGFILNTKNLALLGQIDVNDKWTDPTAAYQSAVSNILYTGAKQASGQYNVFTTPSTYPHLIFNEKLDEKILSTQSDELTNNGTVSASGTGNFNTSIGLYRAEGIYIVAVADPGTNIINKNQTAYYDFYIRTCWYGTGDQTPSTISTVIRLYNPDITTS